MKRNALVAQSGGPSPVINSSLQGVVEACLARSKDIGTVLAAWHGIEGVLLEELIDMGRQPRGEIALLGRTPAAGAVGTCRYKLTEGQEQDFERIVDVMKAHDVGWFFYIGGNDSMDTAAKVSALARARGVDLVVTGVPKTIDNDIGDEQFRIIDHTPGYGSTARYWAHLLQNVEEENRGMCVSEPVAVLQAMGRKSGFITAAARLGDPERRAPLQLYMAESHHTLESLRLADIHALDFRAAMRTSEVSGVEHFGHNHIGAELRSAGSDGIGEPAGHIGSTDSLKFRSLSVAAINICHVIASPLGFVTPAMRGIVQRKGNSHQYSRWGHW